MLSFKPTFTRRAQINQTMILGWGFSDSHRRPAAEMNGPANRPRDAVANPGPHRALVLAVIQ